MLTPAIILNSSPAMWLAEPMPPDAMLILPGLALAPAMNSGSVLTGTAGFTSIRGNIGDAADGFDVVEEIEVELLSVALTALAVVTMSSV